MAGSISTSGPAERRRRWTSSSLAPSSRRRRQRSKASSPTISSIFRPEGRAEPHRRQQVARRRAGSRRLRPRRRSSASRLSRRNRPVPDCPPPRDYFPVPVVIGGVMPLQLSRWPVTESPTVTESGIALVEDADFIVKYDVGQLLRLDVNGWPKCWPALPTVVQYPAGYKPDRPRFCRFCRRRDPHGEVRFFAQMRDPALRSENITGAYEATYWLLPDRARPSAISRPTCRHCSKSIACPSSVEGPEGRF